MKLTKLENIEDIEHYSFFYQKNYSDYEAIKGWKIIFVTDDYGTIIALKLRASRLIKQAQYLYPPLKKGKRLSLEQEKEFLENLIVFCKQNNICDFISPPSHFSLFQNVPSHSYFTELGIIMLDLRKSNEELFKSFSSNYRNEIRKSISEGIVIKFGNHLFDTFYSLYKVTHQRQGAYFDSEEDLKNLVTCLGEQFCMVAVAQKGNKTYGATLVLFNDGEAYYYQAGSVEYGIYPGANKLLQFELIKWLKQKGIQKYCLGGYRLGNVSGTKYAGIQKFKIHFGGIVEKGYHFYSTITWRYSVYKFFLGLYLKLRGLEQNTAGLNWRYN